ncbi:MAG TPA: thioredoxin domain-containing protein, partial [Acetobacteraceae bacterium]|nr:thioredoxin domain-containing protein [Acetobacteraceae bacterium]
QGKAYWIFRDFPLDRVALTAAMVARELPPSRYASFIFALFASQDRWAFAPNVNSTAQLQQMATLAGMSAATFNQAIANKALENFILSEAREAQEKYHVDSTPTFIINGQSHAGEMPYADFAQLIAAASG